MRDKNKEVKGFNVLNFADQKGYLTTNQLEKWNKLLEQIPKENHVYVHIGIKVLNTVEKQYNEWISKADLD